jgi:hypothetical protein
VRTVVALLLLTATLGTAGCARDGDERSVRSVADAFFAALAAGDGQRACEQLTPDTRAELESREQSTCGEAITGLGLDEASVVRANVYLLNAIVELSNGEAAFLDQGTQGWRIAAVGCQRSGRPADRPFDCEVKD